MDLVKAVIDAVAGAGSWDESLMAFLKATSVSQWIANDRWVWPIAETLHFIGLTLLIGIIGPLDLRLIGFMKRVPITALKKLVPWAVAGFVTCLVTGITFFVATPEQYIYNESFWLKMLFLAIAGWNMLIFETTQRRRVMALDRAGDTPVSFKMIGATSLVSWVMVLYWGRMLPFLGSAF